MSQRNAKWYIPLYLHPAQVDLGQFRVLADFALSYASHVYYSDVVAVHRLKCAARALIDQQASKAGGGA